MNDRWRAEGGRKDHGYNAFTGAFTRPHLAVVLVIREQHEIALIDPDAPAQAEVARTMGTRRQLVQKQADAAGLQSLLKTCLVLETTQSTTK